MARNRLFLIVVVIVGIGLGWHFLHSDKAPVQTVVMPMAVTMVAASQQTVQDKIDVNGTLVARDDVVVSTELSGLRVIAVSADEGQRVKKGQILARLDASMLVNEGHQLKADLDKAAADYNRAQMMIKTGTIPQEKFDDRQAAYQSLKARYDNNLLQRQRTDVIAPVNGVIYQRQIAVGDLVQGNQVFFNIAADGESELAAAVPEAILSRLKIGGEAVVHPTGQDQPIAAIIRLIAPRVDNMTRTADIRLRLKTADFLVIGSFAQATLMLGEQQGLAVPPTAVMTDSDGPYVWVAPNDVAQRQAVRVIHRTPDLVLVDGIMPGQPVVARAGGFLQAGDKIRVIDGSSHEK